MKSLFFAPSVALSLLLILGLNQTAQAATTPTPASHPATASDSSPDVDLQLTQTLPELASELFNRAIRQSETMPDRATQVRTLSTIALRLAEAEQNQDAIASFNRAFQLAQDNRQEIDDFVYGEVLRDVLSQMAQAGFIDRALQLVPNLPNDFRKAEALNAIAVALIDQGETERARQVLLDALQRARGITGDYAYESNGSCANYKFEVMSSIAVNLNLISELDRALEVAKSVTGCGSASGEGGVDYQAIAFISILGRLTTVEQVQQTWDNAQTISNASEKAEIWSAIATKFIEIGEPEQAMAIVERFANEIPPVTSIDSAYAQSMFWTRERALRAIATQFAKQQQFDAALQVTTYMVDPSSTPLNDPLGYASNSTAKAETFAEIAHQYAIAGRVSDALEVINSIPNNNVKTLSHIALAYHLQQTSNQEQATQLLQQLPMPPQPAANDFQATQSMSQIAIALTVVGQVDRAIQLVESLPDSFAQTNALRGMAEQLARTNQADTALTIANRIQDADMKWSAHSVIAVELAKSGQTERALQIANAISNPYFRKITQQEIALQLSTANQPEQALQLVLAESTPEGMEHTQDHLLATVAVPLADAGQQTQALQAVEAIADDRLQAETLAAIAAALSR